MPFIMCTQKLLKALGHTGRRPHVETVMSTPPQQLGNWALRSVRDEGRELVLALEERTYLTVVFPLIPVDSFRSRFSAAIREALTDLGVPPATIATEIVPIELVPLATLTDRALARSLSDLEYFAQIELSYSSDLRRVQRNLNEVPHANVELHVPVLAVARRFGSVPLPRDAGLVH